MRKYADVPWYEKPILVTNTVDGVVRSGITNGQMSGPKLPERHYWHSDEAMRADIEELKNLMAENRAWDLMMSGYDELAKMVTVFSTSDLEIPYLVKPSLPFEGDEPDAPQG